MPYFNPYSLKRGREKGTGGGGALAGELEHPGLSPDLGFRGCVTLGKSLNLSGFCLSQMESRAAELRDLKGSFCATVLYISKFLIHSSSGWYLPARASRTSELKSYFHRKLKQNSRWGFNESISDDL